MDSKSVLILMTLITVCLVEAQYKEFNISGVYVKILGLGSDITTAMSPDIAADARKVTIDVLELGEVANDANFTPLQTVSLTGLTFTLSGPYDAVNILEFTYVVAAVSLPNTNIGLSVNVAMFKSEGEWDIAGEKTAVAVGDMKVQLSITGDAITSVADALMQLKINVKGISTTPTVRTLNPGTDGVAYELGDGALVKLSKKVVDRSSTTTLTDQTLTMEDNNFVMRFPRPLTSMRISYVWFITPAPIDVTFSALGVYTKITGMRGVTTISLTPALDADPDKITLSLFEMKVCDANSIVYSSSTFDDVRFIFDDVKDVTVSASAIPASMAKGTTKVLGGILEVYLYIFTSDGVMTYSGLEDNTTVKAGDVRQELVFKGYTLGVDRFLDVTMDIRGPSSPTLLIADNETYDLGNRQAVNFSKKVWVGADYINMTADYPKLETGSMFLFRFPNFDGKTLSYDMIIRRLEKNKASITKSDIFIIIGFFVLSVFLF